MHFLGFSHSHEEYAYAEPGAAGRWWLRVGLLALAGLAGWLAWRTVFFVDETEYVYVTQFGEPLRLEIEPGLRVKWPYQSLWRFDRRLQIYEPPGREMLTEDKENLDFEWYVCWRIPSPEFALAQSQAAGGQLEAPRDRPQLAAALDSDYVRTETERYVRRYLQSVGGVQAAESRLEERIQAALAAEIGRTRLSELATLEPGELKLAPILDRVSQSIRVAAIEQFGIEVVDVRLKRFNYPQAVKPAVFAEIRSERERVAVQYRAEGESEKMRIESQAALERDRLLAQAQREATRMRGEGEAKAMEIFNAAHGKNPAFYQLLKTLETYRTILDEQTTVVLSADSPLLKLLTQGLPEPSETPGPTAGRDGRPGPSVGRDGRPRPSASISTDGGPRPSVSSEEPVTPTAVNKQDAPQAPAPQVDLGPPAAEGAAP